MTFTTKKVKLASSQAAVTLTCFLYKVMLWCTVKKVVL